MKVSRKVKIKNALGLHVRPATIIVKMLQGSKCSVHFTHKKEMINAKSIMSILMLAAAKNSVIAIDTEGEDAEAVMVALVDAFEQSFGE